MAITITETSTQADDRRTFTVAIDTTYTITTTLTINPSCIHDWVQSLMARHPIHFQNHDLILGMAIQMGCFGPAVLSLCSGEYCLVVYIRFCPEAGEQLRPLLEDNRVTFVGLTDVAEACLAFGFRLLPNVPINLRRICFNIRGLEGIRSISVASIAREFLGVASMAEAEIGLYLSDWHASDLSLGQVKHATLDAFVPFCIGVSVQAWNFNPRRLPPLPPPPTNLDPRPSSTNFNPRPSPSNFNPPPTYFDPSPSSTNFNPRPSPSNFNPPPTNFDPSPSSTNFNPRPSRSNLNPPPTNFDPSPSLTNFNPLPSPANFDPRPSSTNFNPRPFPTNFYPSPSSTNFNPHPSPVNFNPSPTNFDPNLPPMNNVNPPLVAPTNFNPYHNPLPRPPTN